MNKLVPSGVGCFEFHLFLVLASQLLLVHYRSKKEQIEPLERLYAI